MPLVAVNLDLPISNTARTPSMKALVLVVLAAVLAAADPTVYLIRHGEKPGGKEHGLSERGKERAKCLRCIFDQEQYEIGYIIAQKYKESALLSLEHAAWPSPN